MRKIGSAPAKLMFERNDENGWGCPDAVLRRGPRRMSTQPLPRRNECQIAVRTWEVEVDCEAMRCHYSQAQNARGAASIVAYALCFLNESAVAFQLEFLSCQKSLLT